MPESKRLRMTGAETAPVFYANVGSVLSTPFDIQLLFGEVIEAAGGGAEGRITVRIIMTPEHVALLLPVLSGRLQEYTKRNGKLRSVAVSR